MRNRKTFIGIVLLIAVLLIGIGYAAITSNLTISGTAKANASDANFSVVFTGEIKDKSEGVTASATENTTSAIMNVEGLTTKGDAKSATFTVQNTSDELQALLSVATEEVTNTEYFAVSAEVANEDSKIKAGGTTTVTVTVTLIKTPTEEVTSTVNVGLTATAVAAD